MDTKCTTSNRDACDPCEENFERNIDQMVGEVEGYSRKERDDRRREVEEAYDRQPDTAHRQH